MTKQEMLAELTAQIRKDIPRTMELREGCILSDKSNKDKFEIIGIDADFDEYVCLKNKKYLTSVAFKNINLYEVIGHDIMLNDVLEWVKFNAFNVEFQENGDFNLYGKLKMSKNIERYSFVNWNLSYPYLKDQSEELIKFLYDLKQKKLMNKQELYNKFNGLCAYTGKPLGNDWQIDHIKPKRQGGTDDFDNLLPALKIVNHYKRGYDLEGFRKYMLTFHLRLVKLPKNTSLEKTKKRITYMQNVANSFDVTIDNPFKGKFYFETLSN